MPNERTHPLVDLVEFLALRLFALFGNLFGRLGALGLDGGKLGLGLDT